MPHPQTTWLPVSESRLSLASPMRGKPWAHKALFRQGRQAQSPSPFSRLNPRILRIEIVQLTLLDHQLSLHRFNCQWII